MEWLEMGNLKMRIRGGVGVEAWSSRCIDIQDDQIVRLARRKHMCWHVTSVEALKLDWFILAHN
jgi:hypothetical protein